MNIESIKRKIAYRARFIGLRFGDDDIFSVTISPGNEFVTLARHYTYEESELDDMPVKVYHNLLWFEYSQAAHAYKNNTDFTVASIPAPVLIMRISFLAYWIRNDEKIGLDEPGAWDGIMQEIVASWILDLSNEYLNHCTS